MKCPACSTPGAYQGFQEVECVNSKCEHYSWRLAHEAPEKPVMIGEQITPNPFYAAGVPCLKCQQPMTKGMRKLCGGKFEALYRCDNRACADYIEFVDCVGPRRVPQFVQASTEFLEGKLSGGGKEQITHKEICRWTMKNSPEGEKCRFVGWTDQFGNRNVALEDTYATKNLPPRKWWVIQPPDGEMRFKPGIKLECPKDGGGFMMTQALNQWPGSDRVEDHLVVPETFTAKEIPSTFEAMWSIAKPIENCEEGSHVIGHYEAHK